LRRTSCALIARPEMSKMESGRPEISGDMIIRLSALGGPC
jgi:hypothetical protein